MPPEGAQAPALAPVLATAKPAYSAANPFAPWADPNAKPLVEIRGVTKKFGEYTALDDVSLAIYPREFFAILGPSGCGKTTMMRLLAGFEEPTAGVVALDGQDLRGVPPNRRPVNMMFQSYALFPHLSVEDNIAFGLRRDRMAKDAIAERVAEMLTLVQLTPYARRKPHQLSGGQRQRVALARALAKRPKLMLLDEPLGALDKKLRQETQFELMSIQEKLGATFVIVTHDQEEAMTVSSRIAVMNKGKVAQVATPSEIYEYPATRFVADFIGDVNILEGAVRSVSDGVARLELFEGAAPVAATLAGSPGPAPSVGGRAAVTLRPEKLRIAKLDASAAPEAPGVNSLDGVVADIAYLGNLSTYHVRLADGRIVKAQEANRLRVARREIFWDDRVRLTWAADAGVLLTR